MEIYHLFLDSASRQMRRYVTYILHLPDESHPSLITLSHLLCAGGVSYQGHNFFEASEQPRRDPLNSVLGFLVSKSSSSPVFLNLEVARKATESH